MKKHCVVGIRYNDRTDVAVWNFFFKNKKQARKKLKKIFNKPKYDDIVILFSFLEVERNSIVNLDIG